ncbi:hypothetical protein Ciccas_002721 [Cichlidogyrus casuarinus]|uniref:Dynein regulatory complex protein 10 n=1 Tax=Cichlidogyrus casuarinus TaxID=1844966 RepID=A0ABD2QGG2_9PLAT
MAIQELRQLRDVNTSILRSLRQKDLIPELFYHGHVWRINISPEVLLLARLLCRLHGILLREFSYTQPEWNDTKESLLRIERLKIEDEPQTRVLMNEINDIESRNERDLAYLADMVLGLQQEFQSLKQQSKLTEEFLENIQEKCNEYSIHHIDQMAITSEEKERRIRRIKTMKLNDKLARLDKYRKDHRKEQLQSLTQKPALRQAASVIQAYFHYYRCMTENAASST